MTLEPYTAEKADRLAWRALDLTCGLRRISKMLRDDDLDAVSLHDKKALEWLLRLENWLREANAKVETASIRQRAIRSTRSASGGAQ